jgi:Tfp pilus assembly protein PilV
MQTDWAGGPLAMARGFTLAEGMIASVVLALAAAAMAGGMVASQQQSSSSRQDLKAVALGRELMEEVVARPFAQPLSDAVTMGHSSGDVRTNYTYISDYDGYTDTTADLKDQEGNSIPLSGQAYTRRVSVQYISPAYTGAPAGTDCALVTVTVTEPIGRTISLARLATRVVR